MRIFCIGDIFGRPGRRVVREFLEDFVKSEKIDYVIANAENLAHGKGMTKKTIDEMKRAGVNYFTGGNHSFSKEEYYEEYDKKNNTVIRPSNIGFNNPGKGDVLIETDQGNILLINLLGRVFMPHFPDNPFTAVDEILEKYKDKKVDASIVDFHAEATGEKYIMRRHLDGRVSVLFGTHTHIPTADAHVTDSGMGYISDLGMTGAVDSSIGLNDELMLEYSITQLKAEHEMEVKFPYYLRGIVVDIENNICKSIKHVQLKLESDS